MGIDAKEKTVMEDLPFDLRTLDTNCIMDHLEAELEKRKLNKLVKR